MKVDIIFKTCSNAQKTHLKKLRALHAIIVVITIRASTIIVTEARKPACCAAQMTLTFARPHASKTEEKSHSRLKQLTLPTVGNAPLACNLINKVPGLTQLSLAELCTSALHYGLQGDNLGDLFSSKRPKKIAISRARHSAL